MPSPKPDGSAKSILIMNVHPSTGFNPTGPTRQDPFAPGALYEIMIDTNGDAVADIPYSVRFSPFAGGTQTAAMRRVEGAQAAGTDEGGRVIVEGAPVSMGGEARVTEAGDHRFFAGWRSDPFFFDVTGALKDFQFTGTDYFVDKDVCSIVLEVPNAALGPKAVSLWARTVDDATGSWIQADRGARPSQAVFLPGDERNAYLAGTPADDARFIDVFAHSLQHTGGYSSEDARRVAASLLPDILRFDPTRAASLSGQRAGDDDVLDGFISDPDKWKSDDRRRGNPQRPARRISLCGTAHRATSARCFEKTQPPASVA